MQENPQGKWKKLSEFGKDSKSWDKLKNECKECKNFKERNRLSENKVEIKRIEKEKKEKKDVGSPISNTQENIEKLLFNYGLILMEDIEDTDKPSKVNINFVCTHGHETIKRLDSIKTRIKEFEENKLHTICPECNEECIELKKLMDNEEIVEEKGFILEKMYSNERKDIIYDIKCKNGHLTTGRTKTSFMRSFSCKECSRTASEYKCSSCNKILPLGKFNKCATNTYRNGTDHQCRDCRMKQNEVRKTSGYLYPSKEKMIIDGKEGKLCSTKDCGFHEYSEYYSDKCNQDGYSSHCKKCKDDFSKKYALNNSEKIKNNKKEYREKNKEYLAKKKVECKENNREKFREMSRNYQNNKRNNDPNFKLLGNLRHRVYLALKNNTKSDRTMNLIGCSIDELWIYLESKFTDGMTRENYGSLYHIDHIIPCSKFDLSNEVEQRRCFNYRNLQPMYGQENIAKSDNYTFDIVHEIMLTNIK